MSLRQVLNGWAPGAGWVAALCAGLDAEQYKLFRELVISIIIATDLDNHEGDLARFSAYSGTQEANLISSYFN